MSHLENVVCMYALGLPSLLEKPAQCAHQSLCCSLFVYLFACFRTTISVGEATQCAYHSLCFSLFICLHVLELPSLLEKPTQCAHHSLCFSLFVCLYVLGLYHLRRRSPHNAHTITCTFHCLFICLFLGLCMLPGVCFRTTISVGEAHTVRTPLPVLFIVCLFVRLFVCLFCAHSHFESDSIIIWLSVPEFLMFRFSCILFSISS